MERRCMGATKMSFLILNDKRELILFHKVGLAWAKARSPKDFETTREPELDERKIITGLWTELIS